MLSFTIFRQNSDQVENLIKGMTKSYPKKINTIIGEITTCLENFRLFLCGIWHTSFFSRNRLN